MDWISTNSYKFLITFLIPKLIFVFSVKHSFFRVFFPIFQSFQMPLELIHQISCPKIDVCINQFRMPN